MTKKTISFLIPVRKQRSLPGIFTWAETTILNSCRDTDKLPLSQLANDLKRHLKTKAKIIFNATGAGDVIIARDPSIKEKEGYRLIVNKENIIISASTDAGIYYGIQTLRDLIIMHGKKIPCCRIDDSPDFSRRAVYHDTARGRVPKIETVKAFIERLARWKINELQFYIKNTFTWAAHPSISKGFSPYTPDDILEIQAYCHLHHIKFVPSIATLSHNELILQLPEYRHLAELPGYNGWEGGTMLCPTNPKSFTLIKELHNEFLPLFESDEVNLCCDEPWELGQGRSKRTADRIGRGQVYLNFLLKLHRNCEKHGKRMNIWGDIVLKYPELIKDLPKDVVMLNWDYEVNGPHIPRTKEFVDAGLPVLACPGTQAWQRHGTDLPKAIGNVSNFARIAKKYNIEGILNTDWGDFGNRNPLGVSLHGYAHGAAHSWNTKAVNDKTFTEIFAIHFFNESKRMANAIKTLGACASLPNDWSCSLYHTLIEPIHLPTNRFIKQFKHVPIVSHYPTAYPNHIDTADSAGLRTVIRMLTKNNLWPEPTKEMPEFEKLALADYKLAADMDIISAKHALLGQAYRKGKPLPASDYKDWADSMNKLSINFKKLWTTRYRPSRLADNLRLMRMAEKEARTIV